MKILETPITVFDSVTSTNGRVASLAEFLKDVSPHQLIQQIRMTEDKAERTRLKSSLPCATISAICPDGRKADDVFEHTGLTCIDIDGQDNPGFGSGAELQGCGSSILFTLGERKRMLRHLSVVASRKSPRTLHCFATTVQVAPRHSYRRTVQG